MEVIVDAGGTSCTWIFIFDNGETKSISTDAIHALLTPDNEITRIARVVAANLKESSTITHLHFYGAGCINSEVNNRISRLLSLSLPVENVSVNTDMLCAARALFQNNKGIACILGTGSNSCLYNGSEIIDNVSPLGFILGDEGSGAVLGRTLLGNILKHQLPPEICESFWKTYPTNRGEIIENVYRKQSPNRYLASFTPFLKENIYHPDIEALVINSFISFLKRNVMNYEHASQLTISFIGSIAHHFSPQLEKALALCNLRLETIQQTPIEGITNYHLSRPSVSR